ncbi:MAG: hypothetical protein ACRDKU_04425 [Gaiellaceae bacterium]
MDAPRSSLLIGIAPLVGMAMLAFAAISIEPSRAEPVTNCANEGPRFIAQAGIGVRSTEPLYDGVQATVTPLTRASGLSGCEKIAGIVAIGRSRNFLIASVYAHARLPGKFVPKYEWMQNGNFYGSPAVLPGVPWAAQSSHTLRLTRVRSSSTWSVEIDGTLVRRASLPGSQRGLALPKALLVADNHDRQLNRGSFRFDNVLVRPAGAHRWAQFPRGNTWLYTDHASYMYVKLPVRTSFIAKSR